MDSIFGKLLHGKDNCASPLSNALEVVKICTAHVIVLPDHILAQSNLRLLLHDVSSLLPQVRFLGLPEICELRLLIEAVNQL